MASLGLCKLWTALHLLHLQPALWDAVSLSHPCQLMGAIYTSSTHSHSCITLRIYLLRSALWDSAPFPPWPVITSVFIIIIIIIIIKNI